MGSLRRFARSAKAGGASAWVVGALAFGQAPGGGGVAPPPAAPAEGRPAATAPASAEQPYPDRATPGAAEVAAEQERIWNSAEMREARAYVAEYAQRSRQFTPAHADRYLESLRQASPEQMEHWLSRFAAQRAAVRRGNEVQHRGREIAVQQSLDRLQAAQRSFDRITAGQSASASAAQGQIAQQRRVADQAGALRRAVRDAQLSQWRTPAYDWLIFPPVYVQQMAAATLPGDLPAGDPRNEIRGDVPESGK